MPDSASPTIVITRRAADRLRAGHLWVYRSDLMGAEPAFEPGALVTVLEAAGRPLGSALYSTASQIALRLVSQAPYLTREVYLAELRTRVREALSLRRQVAPLQTSGELASDAQRLIFSEADALPGIVVDRYAGLLIVQLLTQGTAQDDVRVALTEVLREELGASGGGFTILERPDPRVRELEQLPVVSNEPLFSDSTEAQASTVFTLNGLRFGYDAGSGQKTGAFLDQRLNYAAAAEWVRRSGRTAHALDVCTYHGGFALHLAQLCGRVTGVDQSRTALEVADGNLTRNGQLPGQVDWIEADAFEFLRALDDANRSGSIDGAASPHRSSAKAKTPSGLPAQFDAIVLDPPAFAKSKRALDGALRGYKELNLRAMRLLVKGGTLITCSCSHHVSREAFLDIVTQAAADAGRRVQLLEARAAAPDHPEVLTLPETSYLKCLILRVD